MGSPISGKPHIWSRESRNSRFSTQVAVSWTPRNPNLTPIDRPMEKPHMTLSYWFHDLVSPVLRVHSTTKLLLKLYPGTRECLLDSLFGSR